MSSSELPMPQEEREAKGINPEQTEASELRQQEIRNQRQRLEDETRKLQEQFAAQLKQLQKDCLHPNVHEYRYIGGRDEGRRRECRDCGWDDQN